MKLDQQKSREPSLLLAVACVGAHIDGEGPRVCGRIVHVRLRHSGRCYRISMDEMEAGLRGMGWILATARYETGEGRIGALGPLCADCGLALVDRLRRLVAAHGTAPGGLDALAEFRGLTSEHADGRPALRHIRRRAMSPAEQMADECPTDAERIVRALAAGGYAASPVLAAALWCDHSEGLCAGWLVLPKNDSEILDALRPHFILSWPSTDEPE